MRLLLVGLYYLPKALARHSFAADIDKQRLFAGQRYHLRAHKLYVLRKRFNCGRIQRYKAFLILTDAPYNARRCIYIAEVERYKLAYSYARCVQKLKHRSVSIALGIRARGLLQKQLNLFAREYLRELMRCFIRRELTGRVFCHNSVIYKNTVKALYRCYRPGDGCNRLAVALEPFDIFVKLIFRCAVYGNIGVNIQIITKLADIAHI